MDYHFVTEILPQDRRGNAQVDRLLQQEGIRRDKNLDYTCGIYDEDYALIATGSCFGNTLRCLAVSGSHQGEGLMNQIVSHLVSRQFERGNSHIFLYTKWESAKFFADLGFYEIIAIPNSIVFMENRKTGFGDYLKNLASQPQEGNSVAALAMNANPFTLGHQYLVERAAAENDLVHLFVVSEDSSVVPFDVRWQLVLAGTAHLKNVVCHPSGPYIISNATFPSYFQRDEEGVIESHAQLDMAIFTAVAQTLGITLRYVGEEPTSLVTGIYNQVMAEVLPRGGIRCEIIPRKQVEGDPISASTVRTALQQEDWTMLKTLVPTTTYDYFKSDKAGSIIKKIQQEDNLIHY